MAHTAKQKRKQAKPPPLSRWLMFWMNNLLVARAAFQKCVELYPDDLILLKQGIRSRSPKAK
jgi:hypothetical protein